MNPTVSYPAKTYPSVNYPATSYPATFPQRTMYLQQVLHPDDESFDLGFVYRIPAEVDLDRFVAVAMAAIGSCPGFSTRFEQQGDGIRAIVEPGNVLAHNSLGSVLLQRGEVGEALLHFHDALRADPA